MKIVEIQKPSFTQSLMNLFKGFVLTAHAEEPNPPVEPESKNPEPNGTEDPTPPSTPSEPTPSGTLNFEDLVSKARKEERDKLYPEINKQKERANSFLLVIQERDNTIKELTAEVAKLKADLEKASTNSNKGTSAKESELQAIISNLENQVEVLKASHEKELSLKEVEIYRIQKLAEAGDAIIPELVTGSTPEEIDQALELSKTRYNAIVSKQLGNITYPAANLPSNAGQLQLDKTPEEISRMSASEYAEWRKSAGIK